MKTRKITYGFVRETPKNADETRVIPFVLSTGTKDRHNTVINPLNWQLDNFRKNPVVSYMHNLYGGLISDPDPDDIIAKDQGIRIETVSGNPALVGYPQFEPAELNLKAEKIFRKILLGTLRATSVGFIEHGKGKFGSGNEARGFENETYYFDKTELLEYSIVNIPSNPDSVKRVMRDQTMAAMNYVHQLLGSKFRLSQIENMKVKDVLDLLDGKDLDIKSTDPAKVSKMLRDPKAIKDRNDEIERQIKAFKEKLYK